MIFCKDKYNWWITNIYRTASTHLKFEIKANIFNQLGLPHLTNATGKQSTKLWPSYASKFTHVQVSSSHLPTATPPIKTKQTSPAHRSNNITVTWLNTMHTIGATVKIKYTSGPLSTAVTLSWAGSIWNADKTSLLSACVQWFRGIEQKGTTNILHLNWMQN